MKKFILDVVHFHNTITGTGMYMALYLATLLFILFFIKDRRIKRAVLYPFLIILPGVYIGLFAIYRFLYRIPLCKPEVNGRFYWLFMIPPVAALGCTLMVDALKERKSQALLSIILIPVLAACGVFQISDYRFAKAENLYKLPQAFIDIADHVLDADKNGGDGAARMIVPYETAYSFRQYSTGIELLYGEDATYGRIEKVKDERRDVCDTMQTSCPDMDLICAVAEEHDEEYILFDCTYVDFGLESINYDGYTEDENFVGDRTPDPEAVARMSERITVDTEGGNAHWDLTAYGLEYEKTFGRYLLYSFK